MGKVNPQHIFNNLSIKKIVRDTKYEEYIPKLKINGLLTLKDIVIDKNNGTLSDKVKDSIDNDIHRLKVIEIFDKKMENSTNIYDTLYVTLLGLVIYWVYKVGWIDDIIELFKELEYLH